MCVSVVPGMMKIFIDSTKMYNNKQYASSNAR